MPTGRLLLRTTVGGLLLGHGLQKLNGSFGGPGLEATEQTMGALGLHPAKQQALAAALSETAGFLSPLGPAMITGTMLVAIQKVHAKNGVWVTEGGFEYNATIIAAALSLASAGPGALSIDGLFGKQRTGLRWAVLALAMAAGGAAATSAIAKRFAPEVDPPADPTPETETASEGTTAEA
jgi:putative oxidoreductase